MAEFIKNGICCFCGGDYDFIGNNPFPFFQNDENARCCNLCDQTKVIPARVLLIELEKAKFEGTLKADKEKLVNVFENAVSIAAGTLETCYNQFSK